MVTVLGGCDTGGDLVSSCVDPASTPVECHHFDRCLASFKVAGNSARLQKKSRPGAHSIAAHSHPPTLRELLVVFPSAHLRIRFSKSVPGCVNSSPVGF